VQELKDAEIIRQIDFIRTHYPWFSRSPHDSLTDITMQYVAGISAI